MQVKKQQVELDMEQQTGSKFGKEYIKAVYCHPAYLTSMWSASCIYWDGRAQAEIKIARRNINHLRYADNTTIMVESKKELESLLMKVKEESEKVVLELNIQKTKFTASGPITSWEIDGERVETARDFILWGSKDFPGGSDGKASVYNEGDPGSIPGLGRSFGEGNDNPLQQYCLEYPMDRGAW